MAVTKIDHIELIVSRFEEYVALFRVLGFQERLRTKHHGDSVEFQLPGENQPVFEIHRVGGEETGCADGAAGQAAASTRPYSVVRCSSGRPRGSTISPNERSSMRWPCDAPAAREMFSSIRVPPRSFAPAAST